MRNALFALTVSLLSGCAVKGSKIPNAGIPFADAGFTVLGATTEEACGSYILFIDFAHLFSDEGAEVVGVSSALPIPLPSFLSGGTPESSRALYHALEKIPEATHLLDTRVEQRVNGIAVFGHPMFGQRCATVHARGVKIDERPNPEQG